MHHRNPLTRYFRKVALGAALFACTALLLPVSHAAAEGEEGEGAPDDLKAQIKAKIEKIIELMGENEGALIELSTGGKGKTRRVDVEVPTPPPSGSGSGESGTGNSGNSGGGNSGNSGSGNTGTEGSSGGGTAGTEGSSGAGTAGTGASRTGAEVVRKLEELLKSQRSTSSQIPGEIEELLKMIPEGGPGQGGQGQGQGEKPDGSREESGRSPRSAQPRDGTRKVDEQQMGEQQGEQQNQDGDPKNGSDSPRDPNQRNDAQPDDPDDPKQDKRDDDIEAWKTQLPPEYREFVAGGQVDKIPEEYRGLVQRYLRWLAETQSKKRK